jgi:hypothetical protein
MAHMPGAWLLIGATVVLSLATRVSPVWLIVAGAAAGATGWV